jgi:CMP-N-acetylneuraminic acid synthetase
MIAVVALIFYNELEIRFWQKDIGQKYIEMLLQQIESIAQIEYILLLSNVTGWESFESERTKIIKTNPDIWGKHSNQPFRILSFNGNFLSDAIKEQVNLKADISKVICIDLRNPSLSGSTIKQALNQYQRSEMPMLISVREVDDHPCQYQTYFSVVDAGSIHFREPFIKAKNYRPTEPFIVNNASSTKDQIAICFPQSAHHKSTHISILPFQTGVKLLTPSQTLPFSTAENGTITLDLDSSIFDGLLYVLLKSVQGGEYDIASQMESLEKLWYFNECGVAIRSNNGKKILGRQDFPQIFEIDGSLIVIETAYLSDAQTMFQKGDVSSFLVQHPNISIISEYDFLLARAVIDSILLRQ